MDITYQDKLLTCSECGNQFVYTVGQQRMALEEGTEEPELCPVCSVKVERMGRRNPDTVQVAQPATNGFHSYQNGHTSHRGRNGEAYGNGEVLGRRLDAPAQRPSRNGTENYDVPTTPLNADAPKPPSPNRPADYRSGADHPLAGRGGEAFAGHVKWFNDRKGFGFVTLDIGIEIFVHYSGIVAEGYRTLKQNQRVQVTIEDTDKGPQAGRVMVLKDEPFDDFAEPDDSPDLP